MVPEVISTVYVPATPCVDSTYANSSSSLALVAPSIRAILRRTKSTSYLNKNQNSYQPLTADENADEDQHASGRTISPVAANSRRRRSAAPATGSKFVTRSSSDAGHGINSSSTRHGSVELGSTNHCAFSTRSESASRTHSSTISKPRSPSRGRTTRRHDTTSSDDQSRGRTRQLDQQGNILSCRQFIQSTETDSPRGTEFSSSCDADDHVDNVSPSYITKGVFRLQNNREGEEFRFPKAKNEPTLTWRIGDGFSEDETSPEATIGVAGTHRHKRKRSRSLSALGKLSLDTENTVKRQATGGGSSQPWMRTSRGSRAATELWPTRENFTDSSIAHKPKTVVKKDSNTILCSPLLNPRSRSTSRPVIRKAIPRMRQASEFENFGRCKRRSQSRCDPDTPSHPFTIPQQLEYEAGSDSDAEMDNWYDAAGDNTEPLNMADDEFNDTLMAPYIFEISDSGSASSNEDDSGDRDTEMENGTPE